jgi:hypothetical protein
MLGNVLDLPRRVILIPLVKNKRSFEHFARNGI